MVLFLDATKLCRLPFASSIISRPIKKNAYYKSDFKCTKNLYSRICGYEQLCAGQEGGIETEIYAVTDLFYL